MPLIEFTLPGGQTAIIDIEGSDADLDQWLSTDPNALARLWHFYFEMRDTSPWLLIPNNRWDREAVRLWCSGHTSAEIAELIGDITSKTVANRIYELRRIYGAEIVPYKQPK